MAIDHKFIGTEEEGLAIIQQMKKGISQATGHPPPPDVGDVIITPDGLAEVTGTDVATGEDYDPDAA
jgi:hypothetical protein